MSNEILRCNNCGSTEIIVVPHSRIGKCKSCGASVILPDLENHETLALLDQAFIQRNNYEFDKAISTYQYILSKNPNELVAYEGILLSKYGIVYVLDKKTGHDIPTCHRFNTTSIFNDEDYLSYLDNCNTDEEKNVFIERAKEIDLLQKGIFDVLENEEDFDIFISYKSKDEKGYSTEDSQIALDLYDEFASKGYKVFLSEITLKSRISSDFEPIIYRALHSSKFFLLVGTSKTNIDSPWVRNEWSRYIDRIKDLSDDADRNSIICVYKHMNPSDMPRIMNRQIQCVDAADLGYKRNILTYISKILSPSVEVDEYEKFKKYDVQRKKEIEDAERRAREAEEKAKQDKINAQIALENEKKAQQEVLRMKKIAEAKDKAEREKIRIQQERERELQRKKEQAKQNEIARKKAFNSLPETQKKKRLVSLTLTIFSVVLVLLSLIITTSGGKQYQYKPGLIFFTWFLFAISLVLLIYSLIANFRFKHFELRPRKEKVTLCVSYLLIPTIMISYFVSFGKHLNHYARRYYDGYSDELGAFYREDNETCSLWYDNCPKTINAPDTLHGKRITEITISNSSALENLSLSASIYGFSADSKLPNLRSINIPNNTRLQEFPPIDGSPYLTSVVVPNGIKYIYSISNCPNLTSITLPSSNLYEVTRWCFENDSSLKSLDLSNAKYIGPGALRGCSKLASLKVGEVGSGDLLSERYDTTSSSFGFIFGSTKFPKSIRISQNGSYYYLPDSLSYVAVTRETELHNLCFENCSNLVSISLPSTLTSIGYSVFSGCSSLRSINIPSSVNSIGGSIFEGCNSLEEISLPYLGQNNSETIASASTCLGYFSGYGKVEQNYGTGIKKCSILENLKTVTIRSGHIFYGAFSNWTKLENVYLENIKSIGEYAFKNCTSLVNVKYPPGIPVADNAFYGCTIH